MVESQIPNLTFGPSFDHNSCNLGLNEQCEAIVGIFTSKPFQWYPRAQFGACLPFQRRL
jgi:hypothetical protein